MSTTGLDWEDVELNLLTLSFPKKFEAHFKETHFKKSLRHVRSALLLSILFFGIFGYLDAWIVPEAKYQLWFIRYALYCPFAMAVLAFSYSRFFKKYMQISVASVVGLAGLGIIAMIVFVPQSGNNSYYAGLILVFIFGYTFFKLDFIYATATGFMIVSAYEVAAIWSTPISIPILINNNFFFLTVNLFGMFACYSIQLNSRKEFLQAQLLENEKKKVHFANLELENKVEQRTGQLLKANNVLKQEIGERNRAEEHLWESKENYRSILESMEEGYYEIDISGKLRFFNDAFYRIVGYSREELMGTNYRKFTDPQDAGRVFRAFNNVYVSHKPSREFEWKIIRRDGLTRHLEASVSIVKGPEGLPNGFRGVIRDVTDRILAEQSLKKAYQELKYTQSQLVQSGKLASIGELAAGVAHELNQPLMVIRGNAQLVKRFISKGNYGIEDLLKQMEPIERNTKRMMNIINHLRTFSRQSKSEYFALNINQVIEESFLMVGEQLRLRNIEIKKTLDPALPKIMGDMNQLEQVFLNLITNARDAITEKEGGERQNNGNADSIEIITRTSEDNKNLIEILFKDSGKGINDSVQSSIFDPFFTTKEVGKGTGLGLSISYGIIRDHNGQIEIAETGPQGTTFQVKLPIEGPNLNTEPMAKERDRETADGLT
jgi:PAS domain S-box-containing protein